MKADDYRKDQKKWYASSHPELKNLTPEQLFEKEFAERYKILHGNLWNRIIRVHETIYTLEQMEEIPFDYLYSDIDMGFWRLVIMSFIDTVYLKLNSLVNDEGGDVLTLEKFKAEIMKQPWRLPEKKDLLCQFLKERKCDESIRSIKKRVKNIRDNIIAHQLIDWQSGKLKSVLEKVNFGELRTLFDATHSYFGALSFGSVYATLIGDLTPGIVGEQPRRTCLDEVIDAVLRSNDFVKKPEVRGQYWQFDRDSMSDDELQLMNNLRKRIGLPEA